MTINFVRDLLLSQPYDDFTLTNWLVTRCAYWKPWRVALIKYEKSEEWTHKKEGIGAHYRSFYGSIILSMEGNNKKRIKAPGWTMYLLQQQIVNWKHLGGTWAQIMNFGFSSWTRPPYMYCRLWISMIIRNFCIYFNLFSLANFFEVCLIDWYGWSMPCCFRIQEFIFWFDWWKKGCYVSCTYKCIICCQNDNIFVINNKCTCLFSHNFFPWTANIFFKYLV